MVKRLTKEAASALVSDVDPQKYFFIHEGPVLKNVLDLSNALSTINDEQFDFHRNNGKNDFYNWIKDVVGDNRLANDLARAKTKKTMKKRVDTRIKNLQKIIK